MIWLQTGGMKMSNSILIWAFTSGPPLSPTNSDEFDGGKMDYNEMDSDESDEDETHSRRVFAF